MSRAQHKNSLHTTITPSSTTTSLSSSTSLLINLSPSSSLLTSKSINHTSTALLQTTNRNSNSLRQVNTTTLIAGNSAQQQQATNPHAALTTSQYSNKSITSTLKPYQQLQQPLTCQQKQQQPLKSLQMEKQTSLAPISSGFSNATMDNTAYPSAFNNISNINNQQQNIWPTAKHTDYFPSTKMIQPTPPPPQPSSGTINNWPQQQQPLQQQQSQQMQQSFQNVNMYQQNPSAQQQLQQQPQQQWPQNQPQIQQTATYDSFYQQQNNNNNINMFHQQPLPTQQIFQQNPGNYFRQQQPSQPVSQNQSNAVNFFDNSSSSNNKNTNQNPSISGDDWGDWDWNDNSNAAAVEPASEQPKAEPLQTQPSHVAATLLQTQHQANYNNSIIADSFNGQNNNDSWSWGANDNGNMQQVQTTSNNPNELQKLDNDAQVANDNWNLNANQAEKLLQNFSNEHHNDKWNWKSLNDNQQHIAATVSATEPTKNIAGTTANSTLLNSTSALPPPPPTEFSSNSSENHNYNTSATAAPAQSNNIPNTVFVSQAKPVTLPSKQYASPPIGNTPVTDNPPDEAAIMPPQGFQNVEESPARPTSVVSPPLPPPAVATPPLSNIPPPKGANLGGNPFKRAGLAQHHRATALLTTPTTSSNIAAPIPAVFSMPPPPPADFANPGAVSLLEPDNNELPLQENQEVLTPYSANLSLSNATITTATPIQPPTGIPNAVPVAQPPPPNDERNQYLQTSHLSENSEEQQSETDGLLPPPGLSRLVLGEPELEASQQRMVMGTEAPVIDNVNAQAAAMHFEERHADGEDTASENAVSVLNSTVQGVPSAVTTLATDRNLYLVPGESNSNASGNQQQQRVVTGVELAEQREIEMDGENLEDEQQHQHHQQTLSPEARNEPPLEGADNNVTTTATILPPSNVSHQSDQHLDQHHHLYHHHHHNNQLAKSKDSNLISSPNDDEDSDERVLNERTMNQSAAGSSKSRSKYENERLAASSRRRDKRSSVERYESEEYFNSEGEYSSEREERERRERERRRNYREGSVRSDRGGANNEDDRRSRRQRVSNKRDKYYYDGEEDYSKGGGGRDERERERVNERSKTEKRSQRQRAGYDADSRYETEESTRFDSRKDPSRRSMRRSDQANDYDYYNRRGEGYRSSKRTTDNYESDKRERRRSDKHREPRYREDPRYDPREYEEYRKHSSRNARESDMEKDGAAIPSRSGRIHHDSRHAGMYGYPTGGYYDPYTYYYQQMARTNPQAYAEWYKKYYGHAAAADVAQIANRQGANNAANADSTLPPTTVNDGRESVHSGRSSAHNDIKDRYTHAYITQANDYHRHYQHQQQHHFHNQQQQQQQQQQMAFNQSLNSTMLDEDSLNHNNSLYSNIVGSLSTARSNTNLSQIHGSYYGGPAAGVYYARSDYADSRTGAISLRDPDPMALEPQRLTPCKFITEHTVVSFGSGILVTVKPKYTPNGSISNIVKLLKFKPNDETRKLFNVFPGPLVKGLTHKKTVIEFCNEQIRLGPMETTIYAKQLMTNNEEKYRGSYTLMWNLLILLIKQNGMVVGTDIAELLLKNQQQFPYKLPQATINNSLKTKSGSNSSVEGLMEAQKVEENVKDDSGKHDKPEDDLKQEEENLTHESVNDKEVGPALTEDDITEKFRNYLLYGNVNEALDWATDNNLWGHALFLASKLDRRSHANVMMKFANKLSLNDPLQTLYQLMSGRSPSSVTCVQDEKWGDWRPHLSMILSNTSQKPELDRKAITTLGDSLFLRGDLYAAHFCYLMAQVGFGRYQETATQETSLQQHLPKLVLLCSSHYKQFQDFAHNEAIIMTEIYEYACSLNDEKFSIVEFQPYKYLLATRLLDYGFHLKSLMYLEQTAMHIARDSSKYDSSFIKKVYEMADRLKYYDPILEKNIDDQLPNAEDNDALNSQQLEEQKWLQDLRHLTQKYQNDNQMSTITEIQQQQQQHQQQHYLPPENNYSYQQQQIDQQFMEINKQFSELNLQYQQQQLTAIKNTEQQSPSYNNATEQQKLGEQPTSLDFINHEQQQEQQSLTTELPTNNVQDLQQPFENQPATQDLYQQQYLQTDLMQQQQQQQQQQSYNTNFYDPTMQYNNLEGSGTNVNNQQPIAAANTYDYWQQQQQQLQQNSQLNEENARPTISMPKTKSYDTDDEGSTKKQHTQHSSIDDAKKSQQQKTAKKVDKESNKGQQQSNQNSGWFGGIWNKFSLKPKNQMILPDDKNPSIVWDPEKKRWVNTDGDEDEQETLKPPPKMSDLMPAQPQPQQQLQQQPLSSQPQVNQIPFMVPQQQQQQQQQLQQQPQFVPNTIPTSAPSPNPMQQQPTQVQSQVQPPGPVKTPTLQSNMFKMQRNRTLKNAYVDVFNPSGAPVNKATENILAPALPTTAVPQGGFFIPGSQSTNNNSSSQEQQYQQLSQQQDTPQFYNPNQFTSGTGY